MQRQLCRFAAIFCVFLVFGCDDDPTDVEADMGQIEVDAAGMGGAGGMGQGGMGGMGGGVGGMGGGVGGMGGGVGGMGGGGGGVCAEYCTTVMQNCPDAYPDEGACLATCGFLPQDGADGATDGNSVQCRTYHAGAAAEDAATHCPHASANGGEVCGSYCEAYCSITSNSCPDMFPDEATCMAECALLPDDGDWNAIEGDSVQCRIYHGSFPTVVDPVLHCGHATPSGGGVCGAYCDVYCDRMMTNCPDSYADVDTCKSFCAEFPTDGTPRDTSGDSVQCRIYHGSGPSAADGATHCPHASLTGGNVCGESCEVYCGLVANNCSGDNQVFETTEQCMATCQAYPTDGDDGTTAGNSVQCRIYHASFPSDVAPEMHCGHTTPTSVDDVCGTPCEGYCNQVMANCDGTYADMGTCLAACAVLPQDGKPGVTEGNSVQCRTYHASFPSAGEPGTHCPHSSINGGGVCGGYCDVYCDLMEANCGDTFADRGACLTACGNYPTDGNYNDVEGDSVQCRSYHASFPAAADPALHCPHAGIDGGGVCAGAVPDPVCEQYCEAMEANCDGYYPDTESCMTACNLLPQDGEPDAQDGNSAQCRLYHAGAAAMDGATHCPHASTNGGGVCGEYCENYCGIVMRTCGGLYPNEEACMAECAMFPTDGAGNAVGGDSVQCRTYHGSFPAAADGLLHCPHASAAGGDVCGSYCENYCARMDQNCPDTYANAEACMNACGQFPSDGAPGDVDGDSVQCRIYHGSVPAAADPGLHCAHAGQAGGGVCGSYCEVYCNHIEDNCAENTQYPDRPSCMSACAGFPTDGADGAVDGNSAQCRIYHASFPSEADGALHCPHASVSGGEVCGSACDAYCSQTMANCPDLYPNMPACRAACSELPSDGEWNAEAGNSLQCRAYHASFPAAADPALHCAHAAYDGGGVCE